jgi:hypothetical protein
LFFLSSRSFTFVKIWEKITDKEHDHNENDEYFKGLTVNKGIDHPGSFNESSVKRFLKNKKKTKLSADDYVKASSWEYHVYSVRRLPLSRVPDRNIWRLPRKLS